MLRKFIGALICRFKGHRRGRRVECQDNGSRKIFECPRCLRRTEYKSK